MSEDGKKRWSKERDEVLARLTELEGAYREAAEMIDHHSESLNKMEEWYEDFHGAEGEDTVTEPGGDPEPNGDETEILPPVGRRLDVETAWLALKGSQAGVQIAVVNPTDKRYNGGPFIFEDNKDKVIGEGDSVFDAYKDYKAKGGKRSGVAEAALTDAEYDQALFFSTPGNVKAPTSCRHANDGFFCDYYRDKNTHGKVGPFNDFGQAIAELRERLGDGI